MLYICSMKKYYIYTLSHPLTNEVKYIGKTINIAKRYSGHINDKSKSYKSSWIKKLISQGLLPIIEELESFETEKECYEAEEYWIEQFKNWGFKLTNIQSGGIGGCSESLSLELNPNAKIKLEDVLSIKNYLLTTDLTIEKIAQLHNCTASTINNIKYGIAWSSVTGFKGEEKWVRKDSVNKRATTLKELGIYDKQSVTVIQNDLEGNFIKEFKSISEASRMTETNRTSLSQCLNNKCKTANKFVWERKQQ